jgi:hypothetical protein
MKKSKTIRTSTGRKKATEKTGSRTNQNSSIPLIADSIPPQVAWWELVLAKFPTFDPTWSEDVKLKWFEAFDTLLRRGLISDTEK